MGKQLKGIFATPQTPFSKNGQLNEDDLRKEVNFCLRAGVHGIAALVMSAEFSTLSDEERKKITEIVIEEVDHRIPVAIGTAGVSAEVAVMFSKHANDKGADAVIALPPYVRKDDLYGIYKYYKAISNNVNIPIIVQNAPSPMGSALSPSFISKLAKEIEHVEYVKEENIPSPHYISSVLSCVGNDVKGVFGGSAGRWMITEFKRGACGWITACEFCDILVKVYEKLQSGNEEEARQIFNKIIPLIDMELLLGEALSKEVLKRRGIITSNYVRISANKSLDKYDRQELDILLKDVELLFK